MSAIDHPQSIAVTRHLKSVLENIRTFAVVGLHYLLDSIQPRAVVPENLFLRLRPQIFEGHKRVHGMGAVGIGVGVVGGNDDIVVADSSDHIRDNILVHIHRDKTLA